MTAWFIVRSEVAEADRAAFDRWYETEHLPDAQKAFGALSARRGWSDLDRGLHYAVYEFADPARAREVAGSDEIRALAAEFDRVWQDRVRRSREIIDIAQAL